MSKTIGKSLLLSWAILGAVFGVTANTLAQVTTDHQHSSSNSTEQVNSVSQLRDVSPQEWSYEALRNLVEGYGCIVGYPDRTYRGDRALSRYEFAAGLNACLQQLERRILEATADQPTTATTGGQETLQEIIRRAFTTKTKDIFQQLGFTGQLNTLFGLRAFPIGSYPENQITREARIIGTITRDALDQQAATHPIIRTQDLENPYSTSLQDNPAYLRLGAPPAAREIIIERSPYYP